MTFGYNMVSLSQLRDYLERVERVQRRGQAREESYYSSLERLLEDHCGELELDESDVRTNPTAQEGVSFPDFLIFRDRFIQIGYIEAKPPGHNLDREAESEQLQRYRNSFPNLILTDFFEFILFRDGEEIQRVRIPERNQVAQENLDELAPLLQAFFAFARPTIRSARVLARNLGQASHQLKIIVDDLLEQENENLQRFYNAFSLYFQTNITHDGFADLYTQLLVQSMFIGRTQTNGDEFCRETVVENIPVALGFIREVMEYVTLEELPNDLEWVVCDIIDMLRATDVNRIINRYYEDGLGNDPALHFYETYLEEYMPDERSKLGVYYTPDAVVSYMSRSVNQILQSIFGINAGLADRGVTILDPATGTGTFIVSCARIAIDYVRETYGDGAINDFIEEHVLESLYAIELMFAPYAIAHLKMGMLLQEYGYAPEERSFRLYLGNTLTSQNIEQMNIPGLIHLTNEARGAEEARRTDLTVVIGNPPYKGASRRVAGEPIYSPERIGNELTHIGHLLRGYDTINDVEVESYYHTQDGNPLGEGNPRGLSDEYVKFIRFAQWKMESRERGVVALITNNSYLQSITCRAMRSSLMNTFNSIYILNLRGSLSEGDTRVGDKNVFDISQGVSIVIMMKGEEIEEGRNGVFYHELFPMTRAEKNTFLEDHDFLNTPWEEIDPVEPYFLFRPTNNEQNEIYNSFIAIDEIFSENSLGMALTRPQLTYAYSNEEMLERINYFISHNEADSREHICWTPRGDARDWTYDRALQDVQRTLTEGEPNPRRIVQVLYRPFDYRFTYYTGNSRGFGCMPRNEVSRELLNGENLALIVTRQALHEDYSHVLVSNSPTDSIAISNSTGTSASVFPLFSRVVAGNDFSSYINENGEWQSNLNSILVSAIRDRLNENITDENIFHYIVGILYSENYRELYCHQLRQGFPRIPITSSFECFERIRTFGTIVCQSLLLDDIVIADLPFRFEGEGDNRVVSPRDENGIRYDENDERLYINAGQYISMVPNEVNGFTIGSYQPLHLWLRNRVGNRLAAGDIVHLLTMFGAINRIVTSQMESEEAFNLLMEEDILNVNLNPQMTLDNYQDDDTNDEEG